MFNLMSIKIKYKLSNELNVETLKDFKETVLDLLNKETVSEKRYNSSINQT